MRRKFFADVFFRQNSIDGTGVILYNVFNMGKNPAFADFSAANDEV